MGITIEANLWSPRWGHDDEYKVTFTQDQVTIVVLKRECSFTNDSEGNLKWINNISRAENPLYEILNNDSIYPPENLIRCIWYLWERWKDHGLSKEFVTEQLESLVEWVNTTTKAKPKTEFWSNYF